MFPSHLQDNSAQRWCLDSALIDTYTKRRSASRMVGGQRWRQMTRIVVQPHLAASTDVIRQLISSNLLTKNQIQLLLYACEIGSPCPLQLIPFLSPPHTRAICHNGLKEQRTLRQVLVVLKVVIKLRNLRRTRNDKELLLLGFGSLKAYNVQTSLILLEGIHRMLSLLRFYQCKVLSWNTRFLVARGRRFEC